MFSLLLFYRRLRGVLYHEGADAVSEEELRKTFNKYKELNKMACHPPEEYALRLCAFVAQDAARRERRRWKTILEYAVCIIQDWHNIPNRNLSESQIDNMWRIYYEQAPEMAVIRDALKEEQPMDEEMLREKLNNLERDKLIKIISDSLSEWELIQIIMDEFCGEAKIFLSEESQEKEA